MIAMASPERGVTVWGSLQCPIYVQKALKSVFGLTDDKIRVVQAETGGGFGGKEEYPSMISAHAALLALKSGKPVKIIYDRAEDMVVTTKRHPSHTRHRTAVSRDGKLLAMEIDLSIDGGAYATLSSVVLSRATIHAAGPYYCPNVRIDSRAVATNCPPHGAFRGFGAPQSIFAIERHMNKIAAALDLRRRSCGEGTSCTKGKPPQPARRFARTSICPDCSTARCANPITTPSGSALHARIPGAASSAAWASRHFSTVPDSRARASDIWLPWLEWRQLPRESCG